VIVTCERCSTQFRLDDKRVPEQGVRVRCSRCKYAFRVELPVSGEEERIQRAAARGLEPDTPDVTQDLPDEEEDWEFNDHRPTADAQESDGGEVEVEAESGAEEDESAPETAEADPGDAAGFGAEADSPLVETLDGYDNDAPLTPSGLDIEDRSASFGLGGPAGPFDLADQDGAESGLDLAGPDGPAMGPDPGTVEEREPEPEAPPSVADVPDAAEEIGSPDKWDFFAADSSDKATTPTRVRMAAAPPRARTRRSAPVPRDLLNEDLQPHSHWLERVVGSVGWVVVAAIFAAGLYGGFAPGARGSAAASGSQQVADLQVVDVGGRWVDNLMVGDLYVISGVVRRDAAAGDAADSGLFVTLLDADGERLRLAPIPVGPPLPQALLRQADPADLHGAAGQALSPGPGASLHVEAVIPAPPAAASAFRFVTAADLAAPNADTAAPLALADGGNASGESLPSEPEVRSEEPNEAP
jgi:predicted Zn finger-like uncharacterized protein